MKAGSRYSNLSLMFKGKKNIKTRELFAWQDTPLHKSVSREREGTLSYSCDFDNAFVVVRVTRFGFYKSHPWAIV
jgi:hypothetical protein